MEISGKTLQKTVDKFSKIWGSAILTRALLDLRDWSIKLPNNTITKESLKELKKTPLAFELFMEVWNSEYEQNIASGKLKVVKNVRTQRS